MASEVALIFIFNHRYDKNIEILEQVYGNRFSHIYHLVPFYDGNKNNVIPVYENSQYFQGYIAQGLRSYFKQEYQHYLFVGDDLILSPDINERNYRDFFKVTDHGCFIPEIYNIHNLSNNNTLRFLQVKSFFGKRKWYWGKVREFALEYKHAVKGVENQKELPSYEKAKEIVESHGYESRPLNYHDVYGHIFPITSASIRFTIQFKDYFKKFRPAYPVVGSYSDIFIISKSSIEKFCHYCGVFATNKLFVELAIPTALLLSCPEVITEPTLSRRGKIYWLYTEIEKALYQRDMAPYGYKLSNLLNQFPKDKLYIHPIKLSKWRTEMA